jgi:hypothetical protein
MVGPVELKDAGVSLIPMFKLRKAEISCQETSPRTTNPARTVMGHSHGIRRGPCGSELFPIRFFSWLIRAC